MSDHTRTAPRVVVVIPCYRHADHLPAAVASVCAQTYEDLEVVIVDDGSPDDTAAVAERLISAFPNRPIRLLRQSNQGLGASRNNGIGASEAELVLPLDADDLIGPTFIDYCVRALDAGPETSIAYGALQHFGDMEEFHSLFPYDFTRLTRWNLFPCTALFRRRAWLDVGGYDERMSAYEDWDFWLGCAERGHFGVHVPAATFFYRKATGSMLDEAAARDRALKATLIANHPVLFSDEQQAWAQGVRTGDAEAIALPTQPGIMPDLGWPPVKQRRADGAIEGARAFAALAAADELLQAPHLLSAYAERFSAADDATLVICGSTTDLTAIGELVNEHGLDDDDAPDLLGAPAEMPDGGLALAAAKVDALLTERTPLLAVAVPRFDATRLGELRAIAGPMLASPAAAN